MNNDTLENRTSSSTNETESTQPYKSWIVTTVILYSIFSFTSIILNLIAVIVINRFEKSVSNRGLIILSFFELGYSVMFFLLSLCDILDIISTNMMTLEIVNKPHFFSAFSFILLMCSAFGFLRNYWIAYLSTVRFIAVIFPLKARSLLTFGWQTAIFTLILLLSALIGALKCVLIMQEKPFNLIENVILEPRLDHIFYIIRSVIPVILIGFTAVATATGLKFSVGPDVSATHAGRQRIQVAKLVLFLSITFTLLEFPTLVLTYKFEDNVTYISNTFLILNSCCNFFIFVGISNSFRIGLRHICNKSHPTRRCKPNATHTNNPSCSNRCVNNVRNETSCTTMRCAAITLTSAESCSKIYQASSM